MEIQERKAQFFKQIASDKEDHEFEDSLAIFFISALTRHLDLHLLQVSKQKYEVNHQRRQEEHCGRLQMHSKSIFRDFCLCNITTMLIT